MRTNSFIKLLSTLSFIVLASCGKSDTPASNVTTEASSIINSWSGCITGPTSKKLIEQFSLNLKNDLKCQIQSMIFSATFDSSNVFGMSFQVSCTTDCSDVGSSGNQLETVGGTYTVGSASSTVTGATDLNLSILTSDNARWNVGETIYTLYKLENSKFSIGDCFNGNCLDEASRATSLFGQASVTSSLK